MKMAPVHRMDIASLEAIAKQVAEQIRDECVDMCHGDPFFCEDAEAIILKALTTVNDADC